MPCFNSLNGAIDIFRYKDLSLPKEIFQFLKWCDWYSKKMETTKKSVKFQFLKWCDWYTIKLKKIKAEKKFQFLKWCDWYDAKVKAHGNRSNVSIP